jgi:hypothetical protein
MGFKPELFDKKRSAPKPECDNPDCPVHGYKAKGMLRVGSSKCDPIMGHYLFPG